MKHSILMVLLCGAILTSIAPAAPADHGTLGVGVELGLPVGLSGKLWISNRSAIDAAVGWDFQYQRVALQAGYLYHFPIDQVPNGYLAGYAGLGGSWWNSPPSDGKAGRPSLPSPITRWPAHCR